MINRDLGIILLLGALVYGAYDSYAHREIKQPEGVLVPQEPEQAPTSRGPLRYKDHLIDFLAEYKIHARVLSTTNYYLDPAAKLSPIDIALGWGPLSDTRNLQALKISQSGRFYHYGWDAAPPISEESMIRYSANVHMVPAHSEIEKQLKALRKGQIVQLKGYLIRVNGFNGSEWKSSLTRTDTGPGACEILFVESVL